MANRIPDPIRSYLLFGYLRLGQGDSMESGQGGRPEVDPPLRSAPVSELYVVHLDGTTVTDGKPRNPS
jgi:hypothetical protein